jgi:hypothetical protein
VNKYVPPHLRAFFVTWARQNKIKKPDTDEAMQALASQFRTALQQRAAQSTQYVLKEFGEDPPLIAANDRQVNLLRDEGDMIDIVEPEYSNDDFAQMVRGKQAAMDEAGGDDLAAHVIYRDGVEVERNLEAKRNEALTVFAAAPPSWKGAQMGQIFSVPPGIPTTLPGATQQAVNWSGELRETRECTVTAAPVPAVRSSDGRLTVVSSGNGVSRPYLLVEWGTDQGFYHAQIDLGSGVKLTVACCALAVSIGLDGGSTAAMEVYGSMSYGAAPQPTPLTRTVYVDGLTSGNGPSITFRPPFSTQILAITRSDFTAAMTLTYKDLNGNVVGQRILAPSTDLDAPLYLPNDCVSVEVTTGSAGAINARLVYGLTL